MASPISWPAGLLGTAPDGSVQVGGDYVSGTAIFCDFATGNDANAGTEPELPVKTIAQAQTNVAAGGVIAIFATHNEPTASAVAANKAGVLYRGYGTGAARATFTPASGATAVFNVTVAGVRFQNIYFKAASATPGAGGRIVSTGAGMEIQGCNFDCGASDQEGVLLNAGADSCRIEDTTFTATVLRPVRAIGLASSNADVRLVNVTVDGATLGWAGGAITVNSAVRLVIDGLTLAGKADVTGTTVAGYQMFKVLVSGAGKVLLT